MLIHSGLQFGGDPTNVGKQEHDGESPITLHCEFGPQGEGWQGFTGVVGSSTKKYAQSVMNNSYLSENLTNREASNEWISCEFVFTTANWTVFHNLTYGINSA